jgi:hypothetical protein
MADLTRDVPVMDARITWSASPTLDILFGSYKVPFSMEFLENVGRLDFVMRSRAVRAMAPGRDVGLSIRKQLGRVLSVQAGAFNGNGLRLVNDNTLLLYAGRVSLDASPGAARIRAGLNAGFSEDDEVRIPGVDADFEGTRALLGGDFWFDIYAWTLKGEMIYLDTDKKALGDNGTLYGGYLTMMRRFGTRIEAAVRWDRFFDGEMTDDLVLGVTWGPRDPLKLQVNTHLPISGGGNRPYLLLAMAQVAI